MGLLEGLGSTCIAFKYSLKRWWVNWGSAHTSTASFHFGPGDLEEWGVLGSRTPVTLVSHLGIMPGWIRTSVWVFSICCHWIFAFLKWTYWWNFCSSCSRGEEIDLKITFLSGNQWGSMCFLLQGGFFGHLMNSVNFLLLPSNFLLELWALVWDVKSRCQARL